MDQRIEAAARELFARMNYQTNKNKERYGFAISEWETADEGERNIYRDYARSALGAADAVASNDVSADTN